MNVIMLLAALVMFNPNPPVSSALEGGDIHVNISNLKNKKGQVAILLFSSEEGYPNDHTKAFLTRRIKLADSQGSFILNAVPEGDYVLTIIHDENSNSALDKNMFGVPKEGYAVSNNIEPETFGPPPYKEARFRHGASQTSLSLTLNY